LFLSKTLTLEEEDDDDVCAFLALETLVLDEDDDDDFDVCDFLALFLGTGEGEDEVEHFAERAFFCEFVTLSDPREPSFPVRRDLRGSDLPF
jgi:hypothetical protein